MGKLFTLDSYVEKANEQYGCYELQIDPETVVRLHNPIRIEEKKRERVFELVTELDTSKDEKPVEEGKWAEVGADEEMDLTEVAKMQPLLVEFLQLVGDENVDKLLAVVGHDLAILIEIFQDYFKAVGLGEVSSSEE